MAKTRTAQAVPLKRPATSAAPLVRTAAAWSPSFEDEVHCTVLSLREVLVSQKHPVGGPLVMAIDRLILKTAARQKGKVLFCK